MIGSASSDPPLTVPRKSRPAKNIQGKIQLLERLQPTQTRSRKGVIRTPMVRLQA